MGYIVGSASVSGKWPQRVAKLVMSTGRSRVRAAFFTASRFFLKLVGDFDRLFRVSTAQWSMRFIRLKDSWRQ